MILLLAARYDNHDNTIVSEEKISIRAMQKAEAFAERIERERLGQATTPRKPIQTKPKDVAQHVRKNPAEVKGQAAQSRKSTVVPLGTPPPHSDHSALWKEFAKNPDEYKKRRGLLNTNQRGKLFQAAGGTMSNQPKEPETPEPPKSDTTNKLS